MARSYPLCIIRAADVTDQPEFDSLGKAFPSSSEDRTTVSQDVASAPSLEPFRQIQGMGPAMLNSLLEFARTDSNREVVEALASEVRFNRPSRRRRSRRVLDERTGVGRGKPGEGTAEQREYGSLYRGEDLCQWVQGKTVVFTGSLTR